MHLAKRILASPLRQLEQLGSHRVFSAVSDNANDVFGAMPSLHVSYPALVLFFGWPILGRAWRLLIAAFLASMCFAELTGL